MHKTLHKKIVAHRTEGKEKSFFRKKIDQFSNFFSLENFFHHTKTTPFQTKVDCLQFFEA